MEINTNSFQQMTQEHSVGKLKVFGGLQIIFGILCALVSLAGIVIDGINITKTCYSGYYDYYYNYYYHMGYYYPFYLNNCNDVNNAPTLLAFDVTSLVFSGWFIITGVFPFCMKEQREEKLNCLKRAHMICSILGSSLFIPTVTVMASYGAVLREEGDNSAMTAIPSVLTVLAVSEEAIAIAAASYSCCCSSAKQNSRVNPMVYNYAGQPMFYLPNTQIPTYGMQMHPFQPQMFQNAGYPYQMMPQQLPMLQPQNHLTQQQQNYMANQQQQITQQINTGMLPQQLNTFPYGFYGQAVPPPAHPTQQASTANSQPENASTQSVVSSEQ